MGYFPRPDSAQIKLNIQAMLKSSLADAGKSTLAQTAPSAGGPIPEINSVDQEYLTGDIEQRTVICSGTILITNDTVGILLEDVIVGTTLSPYCTKAERILLPLDSGATVANGADVYMISTGLITSSASGNVWVGKFLEATAQVNPDGLPVHTDDWALISFSNESI